MTKKGLQNYHPKKFSLLQLVAEFSNSYLISLIASRAVVSQKHFQEVFHSLSFLAFHFQTAVTERQFNRKRALSGVQWVVFIELYIRTRGCTGDAFCTHATGPQGDARAILYGC